MLFLQLYAHFMHEAEYLLHDLINFQVQFKTFFCMKIDTSQSIDLMIENYKEICFGVQTL